MIRRRYGMGSGREGGRAPAMTAAGGGGRRPGSADTEARSAAPSRRGAPRVGRTHAVSLISVSMISVLLIAMGTIGSVAKGIELAVDESLYIDPELLQPPTRIKFPAGLLRLWKAALGRTDAGIRRQVCDAIGLAAIRGMPGLDALQPDVVAALEGDADPLVRQAAARALVSLDARSAAAQLVAAQARDGALVSAIVEPALARWGFTGMASEWHARVTNPDTPPALVDLAIDGLGRLGGEEAAPGLEQIVDDPAAPPERRLAAALALGRCRKSGLVPVAERLAATAADPRRAVAPDVVGRLAAVRLLAEHIDPGAVELVARLATDPEGPVATAALERLDTLERGRALDVARQSLVAGDAGLRLLAATLVMRPADSDCIARLTASLADRNPTVRRSVAAAFAEFATHPELHGAVIEAAEKALVGDDWRGLEQATLLVGHLDHEPAAERLIALLDHPRPEVAVTAAWGLRKLAVADTLPRLLDYAINLSERVDITKHVTAVSGPQVARLNELFGILRYAPADPLLRRFVPKSQLDDRARQGAIWALGMLNEGTPDEALAAQLAERLADVGSIPPERPGVRAAAALSLGRMRAESQLDVLRLFAGQEGLMSISGRACNWAVERLTGEPYPEMPTTEIGVRGWFLESP